MSFAKITPEMQKLRDYLEDHGIAWKDESDPYICRTHFRQKDKMLVSVAHGFGTYGGLSTLRKDDGLLEAWCMGSEEYPTGWLTAQDVIRKYFGEEALDGKG